MPLAERRGDVGVRGRGAALSLSSALLRGDAIGGQVVWCRRRAMGEPGGAACALVCGANSPSGEGASLAMRRKSVGARAWGSEPSLLPAASPCARTGLRAYGSSRLIPSPRGRCEGCIRVVRLEKRLVVMSSSSLYNSAHWTSAPRTRAPSILEWRACVRACATTRCESQS